MNSLVITRRQLSDKQKQNIILLRFGSLDDFSQSVMTVYQISKRLTIPYYTVSHMLKRFELRGVDSLKSARYRRKPTVLGSKDVETLILSTHYLKKWICFSMIERAEKVWQTFRVRVKPATLRNFYIRYKIKWRRTYRCFRGAITRRPELEELRKSYATKLDYLI